jgi:hypothetical protein
VTTTRPFCISCRKQYISWGKTSAGNKRYRCPSCGKSRKYQQKTKIVNVFQLFKQYVLWGNTYEMLTSLSGYSVRYLEKKFHGYFLQDPPVLPRLDQSKQEEAFLLIDGLWFGRWFVLMVYRQSKSLFILHIAIAGREVTTKISKDLLLVKSMGYRFTGIVSDGGTGIVGAVDRVYPHIPHQICLAHLHRGIIAAIGRYPRDERVKDLKAIADHVWLIESKAALGWWREKLDAWIKSHHTFINERRYDIYYNYWYIHKGVRHAVSTLLELPYTSFKFLDHPLMPKTTNELEAQFGHVGKRWLSHRGMKRERWKDFLKWFIYFYNEEKMADRKTKED